MDSMGFYYDNTHKPELYIHLNTCYITNYFNYFISYLETVQTISLCKPFIYLAKASPYPSIQKKI